MSNIIINRIVREEKEKQQRQMLINSLWVVAFFVTLVVGFVVFWAI